ncbi:MAG: carboxylesterase [Pedobacter sp.]|nr:carboxylesterase [Pedobacter sp.]
MKLLHLFLAVQLITAIPSLHAQQNQPASNLQVKVQNGTLEGTQEASGIHSFKGIPFAKAPVGDLRWKEPQPAENWTGVKKADKFGSSPMQANVFGDMRFRSPGISEDCLFLNVWSPAKSATEKLPVLVYFYGGGFIAGDGSESRYDGESMARKGIVTLTVNYRLGVFGFLAHPELTKESAHKSSGNYGLMDQQAALQWVHDNIAAFGGDPNRVFIAGESAGSISVSAQMASPLSKNLIAGAIGESGAMIKPTLAALPLEEGEKNGLVFGERVKASSLAALRAMPAANLLKEAAAQGAFRTAATVDGYFLPKDPAEIFKAGEQAHVPLLVGWNSAEIPYQAILGQEAPTPENYINKVKTQFAENADEVLKLYPGNTSEEVIHSATALASDRFIVFSTWKWADLHSKTGGQPVYRYVFSKTQPPLTSAFNNTTPGLAGGTSKSTTDKPAKAPVQLGAPHAFEIEYAMGNLNGNPVYAWTAEDQKVSATMLQYFANFIKTGNPNGGSLPKWTALPAGGTATYMNIGVQTKSEQETTRARYLLLERVFSK